MSEPSTDDLTKNDLLSTLQEKDRERLARYMTRVDSNTGDVLQAMGETVAYTWFPCDAAMAAFCVGINKGETMVEVAIIGREGAIGGIVSNGAVPAYANAVVRFGGRFLRIRTVDLEQAKLDSISLRHCFSRYSDCLLAQVFQAAACNATHTIIQRTANWLLAAVARTGGIEFVMTQEELAQMLGVGRTFVNRTVGRLRAEGLISTRRGVFVVRDEVRLRALSCGCAEAVQRHFEIVLPGLYEAA